MTSVCEPTDFCPQALTLRQTLQVSKGTGKQRESVILDSYLKSIPTLVLGLWSHYFLLVIGAACVHGPGIYTLLMHIDSLLSVGSAVQRME